MTKLGLQLWLVACVGSFSLAGAAAAQEAIRQGNIARPIRAVLKAQAEAWNRGEVDGYMAGYARDDATLFVSGDTVTRGWKTVRDRYAKKYDTRAKMGRLSFADVEIRPIGADAALVVGRWKLARQGDRPHGRFTLLMRRRPEGWRIVHDHTSAATP